MFHGSAGLSHLVASSELRLDQTPKLQRANALESITGGWYERTSWVASVFRHVNLPSLIRVILVVRTGYCNDGLCSVIAKGVCTRGVELVVSCFYGYKWGETIPWDYYDAAFGTHVEILPQFLTASTAMFLGNLMMSVPSGSILLTLRLSSYTV